MCMYIEGDIEERTANDKQEASKAYIVANSVSFVANRRSPVLY